MLILNLLVYRKAVGHKIEFRWCQILNKVLLTLRETLSSYMSREEHGDPGNNLYKASFDLEDSL